MTSSESAVPASERKRPAGAMVVSAVLGLLIGFVVLMLVQGGIGWLWDTLPAAWGGAPAWYVLAVPLTAGFLVFAIRRFIGDHGHSPLQGIEVTALSPKEYVDAILAIAASLLGGLVLGPEVALVATGSVIGGIVATRSRTSDRKRVITAGVLGALLALFVRPLLTGSLTLGSPPDAIAVSDIVWAIPVGLVTAVVVAVVRWGGWRLAGAVRGVPRLWALVGAALVISVSALLLQTMTGAPITYVVTSGEGYISDLALETATGTVLAVVIFKSLAYAASLGSGFRGGPFFPVMFVGASIGLLVSLLLPSGPSAQAAIVVGIIAGVIGTAAMSWAVAVILGVVIGFAFGGWALVPAAVLGAATSRLVPRFGDRGQQPAAAATE